MSLRRHVLDVSALRDILSRHRQRVSAMNDKSTSFLNITLPPETDDVGPHSYDTFSSKKTQSATKNIFDITWVGWYLYWTTTQLMPTFRYGCIKKGFHQMGFSYIEIPQECHHHMLLSANGNGCGTSYIFTQTVNALKYIKGNESWNISQTRNLVEICQIKNISASRRAGIFERSPIYSSIQFKGW